MIQSDFDEHHLLHELAHYLPAQAPLKDFVHHNTLHAFQSEPFHTALQKAAKTFGYQTYLTLAEYRTAFEAGKISPAALQKVVLQKHGEDNERLWMDKLLYKVSEEQHNFVPEVGKLRALWKTHYRVNMSKVVHPLLFRTVSSYLDQGVALWGFPGGGKTGFLDALRALDSNVYSGIFKGNRAKQLLQNPSVGLSELLKIVVGEPSLYERYVFDQQFAHPGWSGMAAVLERQPESLLDSRKITLREFIAFELLLEIDYLDERFQENWAALGSKVVESFSPLFRTGTPDEYYTCCAIWQEAMEWSYYDQVLNGLQVPVLPEEKAKEIPLQAIVCIDDRIESFRRYIEAEVPGAETFGTAGFFQVEFYFQPEHGKFFTKSCPAPVTPKFLVVESESEKRHRSDAHFHGSSKRFFGGWLLSQTMGFWSLVRLTKNIFFPAESPAMVSSFRHADPFGKITVARTTDSEERFDGLSVGFSMDEMATRMESLLLSIGLSGDFAPIVYIIGHGASSVNNTHYAGYDCGACSGRPGSVNARVAVAMLNEPEIRRRLRDNGIAIPKTTQFLAALHDTTRDEIEFYDVHTLSATNLEAHQRHKIAFATALHRNAKERARRFLLTDYRKPAEKVHEKVALRAFSLYEPRPEWNHATNALAIVGSRKSTRHLFLDRRAFLNSYEPSQDPTGEHLLGILKAVAPVCGGINLEYYFSRTDPHRLGAGSKLPHNVQGLIGVSNGLDGDLRTGLPRQMVNIHDPLRLLVIVEQAPELILQVLRQHPPTFEWFEQEWVNLVALEPHSKALFRFMGGKFLPYQPSSYSVENVQDINAVIESNRQNLPVFTFSN